MRADEDSFCNAKMSLLVSPKFQSTKVEELELREPRQIQGFYSQTKEHIQQLKERLPPRSTKAVALKMK